MRAPKNVQVAVLLATCNGARFIEQQLESLTQNTIAFTLHWLDDHSADNTRQLVRARARSLGLKLREWHQPGRQFLPGAFFQLLECVTADIYFFCDQDDIWQPGKIDAAVANLLPDLASPVLCFSDSLMFYDDEPEFVRPLSEVFHSRPARALQESRIFMTAVAPGHTQGFTRPLRDLYLRHSAIARAYARNHDAWMYLIASAAGSARMLVDVPTVLYRQHDGNVTAGLLRRNGKQRLDRSTLTWKQQQVLRRRVARHAQGFILAASTLEPSGKLERLVALAGRVATLDRKQSAANVFGLVRRGAMWPNRRWAVGFAAACFWSDADQ
ncbi:MAG TPA: glycosyltransferase [Steroidobacteraceae bacterium]